MKSDFGNPQECDKQALFQAERDKLTDLFKDVEDGKKKLVEGLINDAAFMFAENASLRSVLAITGTVRINPQSPQQQKPVEAARQYRQNVNIYNTTVRTLNSILSKNEIEEDDGMGEFE